MRVIDLFESERNAAIVDETTGVKIWRKDGSNYELMLFRPRGMKPFAHYIFSTSERRAAYIENQLEGARAHNEWKAAQKIERKVREATPVTDGIKPLKQIAREVREQLKTEFPCSKFSVRTEYYSMGQALNVELVNADFKVFRTPDEIRQDAIHGEEQWQTNARDNLVINAQRGYTQLSGTSHVDDSKLFTEEAKKILNRVINIINADNWDHSDIMTDYFDVHYSVRFDIGDSGKPLVEPLVEVEHPEDIAHCAARTAKTATRCRKTNGGRSHNEF
jgi:hypothetical protein